MIKEPTPRQNKTLPYRQVTVEVVAPVYNEEVALPYNIKALCTHLENYFPYRSLVGRHRRQYLNRQHFGRRRRACRHLPLGPRLAPERERARASAKGGLARLRGGRRRAYMDVDLSTNLSSFLPLVAPLAADHSDSRLFKGAMVTRQWKREVISRCYNLLVKLLFHNRFSDAQCGFKALKSSAAQLLLPQVEDDEWFFDTELPLVAEEHGLRIYEVPVEWSEDLDSRVEIIPTAVENVRGLLRVRTRGIRRRLALLTPAIRRPERRW